jgi:hypothetical protein
MFVVVRCMPSVEHGYVTAPKTMDNSYIRGDVFYAAPVRLL